MASTKEYLNYILDQLSGLDGITYRPMMGEYVLYYRSRIIGDICDDRLLVKPVDTAKRMLPGAVLEAPYEGAKKMLLVEETDNSFFLTELFEAMYDELPESRKKARPKNEQV